MECYVTEGPASSDHSMYSSSKKKLNGLSGYSGWRLLLFQSSQCCVRNKQRLDYKGSRSRQVETWCKAKPQKTNFLGPRQACRVCQKPKNNSADRNNDIGSPVNSAKTLYTKKTYCTPSTENNEHTPRYLFLEGLFWEIFFQCLQ